MWLSLSRTWFTVVSINCAAESDVNSADRNQSVERETAPSENSSINDDARVYEQPTLRVLGRLSIRISAGGGSFEDSIRPAVGQAS